jgi:CheY-like chemotaxis protein
MSFVADAPTILGGVADVLWPLIVLVVLALVYRSRSRIGPVLKSLLRDRDVSAELPGGIKLAVGGQPLSLQEAIDEQRRQTEVIRRRVSALEALPAKMTSTGDEVPEGNLASAVAAESENLGITGRVLWVDDHPENNAYLIAVLQDRGVAVDIAQSTKVALDRLELGTTYDAVITDMGRREDQVEDDAAGLRLLRQVHALWPDLAVIVYASTAKIKQYGPQALERGAVGTTADPTALLEFLGVNAGRHYALRFEREVRWAVVDRGWSVVSESPDAPVDFIARRGSVTVAIEARAVLGRYARANLAKTLARLTTRDIGVPVWIVTPKTLPLPHRYEGGVEVMSLEELRERLEN